MGGDYLIIPGSDHHTAAGAAETTRCLVPSELRTVAMGDQVAGAGWQADAGRCSGGSGCIGFYKSRRVSFMGVTCFIMCSPASGAGVGAIGHSALNVAIFQGAVGRADRNYFVIDQVAAEHARAFMQAGLKIKDALLPVRFQNHNQLALRALGADLNAMLNGKVQLQLAQTLGFDLNQKAGDVHIVSHVELRG